MIKEGSVKILVAEDEEVNYIYLQTILKFSKSRKFEVIHAKNGKEAVEMCNEVSNIDLVLMDIKMPVMNGYEATIEIKKNYPKLPIIAQTAFASSTDRKLALDVGCDEYISKPIDRLLLLNMIETFLD